MMNYMKNINQEVLDRSTDNGYIRTYTGELISVFDLKHEHLHIVDIAHRGQEVARVRQLHPFR